MELQGTAPSSSSGESPGRRRRVLVVEDSPLQRRLVGDHLRAVGFAVRVEPTAAEALASLAEARPDAVLCDIVLPGVDGFALCRTIRADAELEDVPVVLVTSTEVDESDHLLARRSGACALVARRPGYDAVVEALVGALEDPVEAEWTSGRTTIADLRARFLAAGRRDARDALDRMSADPDWAALSRTAHRWIGRAGALGFPAISERARELDTACGSHDPQRSRSAMETLARLFDGAVAARDEGSRESPRIGSEIGSVGGGNPAEAGRPCRVREVVIADDDETVLAIVEATLTNDGWRCHPVTDGVEAISAAKRLVPAAVIVDVNMPGRDGFEVLSALRNDRRTREIPVLLLTARQQEIDVIRGFDLGAADYVVKPFNPLELAARLKRLAPEGKT